ncbi:hypothetical protein CEXT_426711 [Caerostris extrusa]|uniref:Uncharacterized protein n=1 Tax=Caerostris extrusa TaxID=172846 RepID=A0AAV4XV88_CAEEX|nr:hypothetical protein CEXT_426711 [Caerostris extrusa]
MKPGLFLTRIILVATTRNDFYSPAIFSRPDMKHCESLLNVLFQLLKRCSPLLFFKYQKLLSRHFTSGKAADCKTFNKGECSTAAGSYKPPVTVLQFTKSPISGGHLLKLQDGGKTLLRWEEKSLFFRGV